MLNHSNGYFLDSIQPTKPRTVVLDPQVLRNNRIVMAHFNDQRADIFRVLRTNVLKQLRENNWHSFVVTSATPGAGKTFISVNLAIAIAMEGNQSVLLVDGDFRRPGVGQYLELDYKYGFVEYLAGVAHLRDILISPGIDNLVLLPTKESGINYSEIISSPKMAYFIKQLKSLNESGIVIIDIPPLFVADDALLFMPHVDAALFVVEDGKSTAEELQHAMTLLEETNLLGLVLNKSRQTLPIYQYGYRSDVESG